MSYNLFLDDKKTPKMCRDYPGDNSIYDSEEFVCVTSYDEFYKTLKENGVPKFVSFDYQILGDEDGLECAKFLKFFCEDLNFPLPEWNVHSNWPGICGEFVKILGGKID